MEKEKFIGCILRLKTKSTPEGATKNIIGTVSDIQIDGRGQRIFLDNGMANGQLLPDGFIVSSLEILDLNVISKAVESAKVKAATPPMEPEKDLKKPKPLKNEKNILQEMFGCPPPVLQLPSATPIPPIAPLPNSNKVPNGFKGFKNNTDTFEMTTAEIKSQEFDFEGSNSLFEKLPVKKLTEKKPLPVKNFTKKDTTYLQERNVSSIQFHGKAEKQFLTDTGVVVPCVPLGIRSSILNAAHSHGLSHSRQVETMARAVAEVTLPLLGDSCRLSPEREEDRPSVLLTCGPNFNGAVGLAAARVLATLGVSTTVYCPKQEINICAVEESLYQLGGGVVHRKWPDESKKYDAVIHSLDDHESLSLSLVGGGDYGCRKVVLVDPPLADYKTCFHPSTKIHVVCPALPLAYREVKVFLVNLCIPCGLFEQNSVKYQSPYGSRLIVQLF